MRSSRYIKNNLLLLLMITGYIILPVTSPAATQLDEQRSKFVQAQKALRTKNINTFRQLTEELKDYPLYPYLVQYYLSSNLWQVKDEEIKAFLNRYGDLTTAEDLRRDWLKYLASQKRWQTYVDNYTPQRDQKLQCYHLHARLQTNNHAYLLEDTRSIWLSGKSLPPQCDTAFAELYKSDLLTSETVWKRITLAMAEGNTSLAKYLSRFLDEDNKNWVSRWIATHHNPDRWTDKQKYEDLPIAREILVYGIYRLARIDAAKAISRWRELEPAYSFDKEQIDGLRKYLTIRAASEKLAGAGQMLEQIPNELVDENIFQWRLATALQNEDWKNLLNWTTGEPPDNSPYQRWLYWRARALEETGDSESAREIYQQLSKERDYYGFLSVDRLGQPYNMQHRSLPEDMEEWFKLSNKPAIVRARELHILGMHYSARREWQHAFRDMTSYQLQIAASIAANWGWHDQTILTLGRAAAYDDLVLRFPMPYQKLITSNVRKRDLDLSWVYALTRAESSFMEDAKSSTGALGLMQVMPATGRETARNLGMKDFYTSHLLRANSNIPIGTEYLRKMYNRFNNNLIVATAAYNAGPNAVSKWLPEKGCVDPEIWIELIPYRETRRYVRRILYFASIYDWRLQQEIKPVKERMAAITPGKNQLVANLTCNSKDLSASL